jgi:hypothetical protein
MGSNFAFGKKAFGFCDICGFRYDLKRLRALTVKLKPTNLLACPQCWTPDQPQLQVGMKKVVDPEALRNPRPDNSYRVSGRNVLRFPSEGSRIYAWGWNPVGFDTSEAPGLANSLIMQSAVGLVSVNTTGISVLASPVGLRAVMGLGSVDAIPGLLAFPNSLPLVGAVGDVVAVSGMFAVSGSLGASAAVGSVSTAP